MKRVNISLSDEMYESLRKLAFAAKVQPGTMVREIVAEVFYPNCLDPFVAKCIAEKRAGWVKP